MPSKSIYQRLFEGWPDPRVLIERDVSGFFRVLTANVMACEYFSQASGSIDGKMLDDFLEAANKDHVIQSFRVAFESGVPISVQVIPILPGGIRLRSFFLNPLKDDDGNVIAIDMTARLAGDNEDALRRERDDAMSIFATIFDASDMGIVVTDHHRRIVRVNETLTRAYGWEAIDLIGQEFTIYVPEDERELARSDHDSQMEGAQIERGRSRRIVRKNGEIAHILVSTGVIELSGQRKFRIASYADITQLKTIEGDLRRAKEEADAASHAKSSFLANMSHELRTPLNAIIGFSDMMLTGTLGPVENSRYHGYLSDIHFSAGHLLAIINDVLDMSKIEAGHMKLDTTISDIVPLLEEVTRIMRARAAEGDITLELHIDENLAPIGVDQRMLRQVLLNLLSNAVKFSHIGGKVCVCAGTAGNEMVIAVKDDGIGIPQNKLAEVMQPFGQVSDPRVAKGQGTGLGLPLARAMVELHGGTLTVESEMDRGTTVTCRLPLAIA